MKRSMSRAGIVAIGAMLCLAGTAGAQAPEMPKPTKEHELLVQFAGEWDVTAETAAAPGAEPMVCKGHESAKMVGGFWLVGRNEASMQGMAVSSVLTLGYDPAAKKYVGTFLCSADSTLWKYEGTMDEAGKKLTLETVGPSPVDPTKKVKYREVLELVAPDHKVFTSYMEGDDGQWTRFVTIDYRRKKDGK
jgi:hypothetical protein